MKIQLRNLYKLKPFDETKDENLSSDRYSSSKLLTIGVIGTAVLTLGGVVMVTLGQEEQAIFILALAVCLSAITSGLEWNAGMKARACNQLFVCVLGAIFITILQAF